MIALEIVPDQVYVMKNKRNGLFKIGISKDPKFREETLQGEEPEIELVSATPSEKRVERLLHRFFASKRVRGEWFKLTDEEALRVSDLVVDGFEQLMTTVSEAKIRKTAKEFYAQRLPAETVRRIKYLSIERNVSAADLLVDLVNEAMAKSSV